VREKNIRIYPKHQKLDIERFAAALLDLVGDLEPGDLDLSPELGASLRRQAELETKTKKGSAA